MQNKELGSMKIFPGDVLYLILHFVDAASLFALANTNRDFKEIVSQNRLWKKQLLDLGIKEMPSENLSYKKIYRFLARYLPSPQNINAYVDAVIEDRERDITKQFLSKIKKQMLSDLRQYISKDRCLGTGELQGVYKIKYKIQSFFSWLAEKFTLAYTNETLNEEQKKDLAFFNRGVTEVARAGVYFTLWQDIEQCTTVAKLEQFGEKLKKYETSLPQGHLLTRVKQCLATVCSSLNDLKVIKIPALRKEKHTKLKQISHVIKKNFIAMIAVSDQDKADLSSYDYFKTKLQAVKKQREEAMATKPVYEFEITERGYVSQCVYPKSMGKTLLETGQEIDNAQAIIQNLYKNNQILFKQYDDSATLTDDKKLQQIKNNEDLYYATLNEIETKILFCL